LRRLLAVLCVALLPLQGVLASGGVLCAALAGHGGVPAAHDGAPHAHAQHAHDAPTHDHAQHAQSGPGHDHAAPAGDGSASASASCNACAPCSGSMAAAAPIGSFPTLKPHGADYPPVDLVIVPVRQGGLERPPRTI
jgi:hypothetical protein